MASTSIEISMLLGTNASTSVQNELYEQTFVSKELKKSKWLRSFTSGHLTLIKLSFRDRQCQRVSISVFCVFLFCELLHPYLNHFRIRFEHIKTSEMQKWLHSTCGSRHKRRTAMCMFVSGSKL